MSRWIPLLLAAVLFVVGSTGFVVVSLGDMATPASLPLVAVPPLTRLIARVPEANILDRGSALTPGTAAVAATTAAASPSRASRAQTAAADVAAASSANVQELAPPSPTLSPSPTPSPTPPLNPSFLPAPNTVGGKGASAATTRTSTPAASPTPERTPARSGGVMIYSGGSGIQGQPNIGSANPPSNQPRVAR